MAHTHLRLLIPLLALALAALPCAALAEEAAAPAAERYVELSTEYPALTAKAGDSLTFALELDNYSGSSQDFTLAVDEIPEGWTGSFSADSRQVSVVHVRDEATHTGVSFAVDVPLEAADGEYEILLSAEGDAGASGEMAISISVNAEEVGQSSFSVEYDSQEGDADTAFSFSATLINNTLSEQSYALAASVPSGWDVSFTPSGSTTKVAALTVPARTSQGVTVSVTPPENIEMGAYEIPCTATSADESLNLPLSVTINGSYGLTLSTPSGRLSTDAYANQEGAVQLSLTNTGNTELTNVNLTSSAPTGWNVRFASETIDLIEAGATVETTAYITPGEDAMSGDYVTTVTARSSDASDTVEFRITVKTETKWGVVGIGVIVLLVLGLAGVMRRFGRR